MMGQYGYGQGPIGNRMSRFARPVHSPEEVQQMFQGFGMDQVPPEVQGATGEYMASRGGPYEEEAHKRQHRVMAPYQRGHVRSLRDTLQSKEATLGARHQRRLGEARLGAGERESQLLQEKIDLMNRLLDAGATPDQVQQMLGGGEMGGVPVE